jgi:MscS family membrane protein
MEKILQTIVLNNSIESYLMVIAIITLAIICKRLISKYFASLLYKMVGKAGKNIKKQSFFDLVVQPLDMFLVVVISLIAIDQLNYPKAFEVKVYHITLRQLLDSIANGAMIILFIWLCIRVIEFIALILEDKANLTKDQSDNQLIVFFKDFFKVLLVIIGFLMIFHFSFNKDVSNLLTGLSIVGAAIALAMRESMENLIASFIIFFDKPFVTGDLVKGSNFQGNIEKIGLRSTRIRTLEKTLISVPNKQMVDSIIDNISLRSQRKVELKLELSLHTSAAQTKAWMTELRSLLQNHPDVETYSLFFADTGKTVHQISMEYFTSMEQNIEDFNETREQINLGILELLERHKIELAAQNTEVVVKNYTADV